eukprot:gene16154-22314_t
MTTDAPKPRSWAEDCNTYRSTRGAKAFSYIDTSGSASTSGRTMPEAPKRYPRTNKVPFAQTTHPLYAYDDQNGGHAADTRGDAEINRQRYDRHGWGDTTLLKQEGYAGVPHPHEGKPDKPGKACPPQPAGPDGRSNLFGVLQMTEQGAKDGWIGHRNVDPDTGKRAVGLPPDSKGRKDLFDVLHARNPGLPADDSWLGNPMVDPAKRKGNPPGPEMSRGRPDLNDIYNQQILREPAPRKFDLLKKGVDPIGDGWIGNQLIHPSDGKRPPEGDVAATQDNMLGSTFKQPPDDTWTDFPNPHRMAVQQPNPDTARDVINSSAPMDPPAKAGRRALAEPHGSTVVPERKDHLYSHMTYKPLSHIETSVLSRTFDDGKITTKRTAHHIPGSEEPGKGIGMLHWKPNQVIGDVVRVGGLSQQARKVKNTCEHKPLTPPGWH